jgi:hypothetical protein
MTLTRPLEHIRHDRDPLAQEVVELATQVARHPVLRGLRTIRDARVFLEHHVWAVWDFMSLLKSLQGELAPVTVPWRPPADPQAARLINEIVVEEEGDEGCLGRPASHFEIYLEAMDEAGADARPVRGFLAALGELGWREALNRSAAPAASKAFVAQTMAIVGAPLEARVGAFALGREEIIPGMFRAAVAELVSERRAGADLAKFQWYLERHVAIDDTRHGPMAGGLFERTCLGNEVGRALALGAARDALRARLALWDAIQSASQTPA